MTGIVPFPQSNFRQMAPVEEPPNLAARLVGGLGDGIAGLLMAKAESEKRELERRANESQLKYYELGQEGQRLDNERKVEDARTARAQKRGEEVGENFYKTWVSKGASPEEYHRIVAQIRTPEASLAFYNRTHKHYEVANQAALAAGNLIDTEVKGATKDDVIGRAGTDAQHSATQARVADATAQSDIRNAAAIARGNAAQAAIQERNLAQPVLPDPSLINAAVNEWQATGAPKKSIFDKYKLPLGEGEDPNERYDPIKNTRGMATWSAQQKQSAVAALTANEAINGLLERGVKIGRFTRLKEAVPYDMARSYISDDEQSLQAESGVFTSRYLQSISGLATTDSEREDTRRQVTPQFADKARTIEQKKLRREVIAQTMLDASEGAKRPMSEILGDAINFAKAKGGDPETIQFFERSRQKSLLWEQIMRKSILEGKDPPIGTVADTVNAAGAANRQAYRDSAQAALDTYGP